MNFSLQSLWSRHPGGWSAIDLHGGVFGVSVQLPGQAGEKPKVLQHVAYPQQTADAAVLAQMGRALSAHSFDVVTLLGRRDYQIFMVDKPAVRPDEVEGSLRLAVSTMLDYPSTEANLAWLDIPIRQTMGSRYDINVITFGARVDDEVPDVINPEAEVLRRGFGLDDWQTVDHSVSGFRIQRKHPGQRIEHHQLVGIKPSDGSQYLLGQVSWLMYEPDGTLMAGIHLLAGLPSTVAVRPTGVNINANEPFSQAFMLPEIAAMRAPATIVLPGGWFDADRVIELDAINPQVAARLARALDRWKKLAEPYRSAAREALARVAAKTDLSNDVREVVDRALAD